MSIEKKLIEKIKTFSDKAFLEEVSILALSEDGQILAHLGKSLDSKETQSLGALLAGLWQASGALKELFDSDEDELRLSFQNSRSGYYILPPGAKNKKIFWSFIYKGILNPGRAKVISRKLRDHMDQVTYFDKKQNTGQFLFKDITEEEMDKLFSFSEL